MTKQNLKLNGPDEQKKLLAATRDGFGQGLVEAAESDERLIGICADLTESLKMTEFERRFPKRFVRIGVSEQLLVALGAGFALAGKIPFVASFAAFSPGRSWEQIRTNVCLNGVNLKVVGGHAGLSVGADGATHQALEDIALMRCLPNMTVIVPCDSEQARRATLALAELDGSAYLRLGRAKTPTLTSADTPFEIGRIQTFRDGDDTAIVACGLMVGKSLQAAEELAAEDGIECSVLNCHTIKPLDDEAVLSAAEKCGAMVTAEEHQIAGGLGSTVSELLAQNMPVPIEFVGVHDRFGQSGESEELLTEYGLTVNDIKSAVRRAIRRKK
ncbi:transketolase [Candidatus Uhrbacteria bacterium CG_4_10_14_0_8_um_filter_58_22]|uniref:Transketolase n=1 Tax=Candidatus Uhrbacteria bacterium CG_4_10_14_0_8_um_filter_58_22 TaxID=1975029 RepID=A0A2M7QAZ9_9BACT|nr:MAG: transketolase [Parcubacteria group bacterium CG1_02_58_44]PIY62817.1 MAG: transketolase [Candidatus Uhrbacteria bacterium CG_4_10_14_0_8_um_filter_58_22]